VYTGFYWGSLEERDNLEDLSVDGKIILKWLLRKVVRRAWGGLILLSIGDQMMGSCEGSNENSGSIRGREFLDHLKT
jgi:hypothetical protein